MLLDIHVEENTSAQGTNYIELLKNCQLCPRRCGADRLKGEKGFCQAGSNPRIALVSLHPWEEPCIAGENGAGTVFFSHCNLRCVYCQNSDISHGGKGKEVTVERLSEIFLEQQARGVATLDLVTPTHYVPQILEALDLARESGFRLPVVYNSGGYETEETLELIRGYVDIFLPDLKYGERESAEKYSHAGNYCDEAFKAVEKMYEIAGPLDMDEKGNLKRGVLIRHMVLPGHRHESMKLLKRIWDTFGENVGLSLMSQYTPMFHSKDFPEINRRLTSFEYDSVVDYAYDLGFRHCYVQERRAASEEYVPNFDGTGVEKG